MGRPPNPASLANLRPWTDQDRRLTLQRLPHGAKVQTPRHDLASAIRAQTQNGEEIIAFMLAILRGRTVKIGGQTRKPSVRHALVAAEWLANRGWGMPREFVELTEGETRQDRMTLIASMSDEDRATLRDLMVRAIAARAARQNQTAVESEQTPTSAMSNGGHGHPDDAVSQISEVSREVTRPVSDKGDCVALPEADAPADPWGGPLIGGEADDAPPA
jgi:hypothetical protein